MSQDSDIKHIIVIDRKSRWREFSKAALTARGYHIHLYDNYDYPPPTLGSNQPALVILGCVTVGEEELQLIEQVVRRQHHLMVFCTAVGRDVMRSVFLKGAEDVTEWPYDVDTFVDSIEHVLHTIQSRNAYQTARKVRGYE